MVAITPAHERGSSRIQAKNTPALSYKLFTNDVGLRVSDSFGFMVTGKYESHQDSAISAGVEHPIRPYLPFE